MAKLPSFFKTKLQTEDIHPNRYGLTDVAMDVDGPNNYDTEFEENQACNDDDEYYIDELEMDQSYTKAIDMKRYSDGANMSDEADHPYYNDPPPLREHQLNEDIYEDAESCIANPTSSQRGYANAVNAKPVAPIIPQRSKPSLPPRTAAAPATDKYPPPSYRHPQMRNAQQDRKPVQASSNVYQQLQFDTKKDTLAKRDPVVKQVAKQNFIGSRSERKKLIQFDVHINYEKRSTLNAVIIETVLRSQESKKTKHTSPFKTSEMFIYEDRGDIIVSIKSVKWAKTLTDTTTDKRTVTLDRVWNGIECEAQFSQECKPSRPHTGRLTVDVTVEQRNTPLLEVTVWCDLEEIQKRGSNPDVLKGRPDNNLAPVQYASQYAPEQYASPSPETPQYNQSPINYQVAPEYGAPLPVPAGHLLYLYAQALANMSQQNPMVQAANYEYADSNGMQNVNKTTPPGSWPKK